MEISKIIKSDTYATLVNNDSKIGTLNEFLTFKESFSPLLFDNLVNQFNIKNVKSIYEPFLGTGSIFVNKSLEICKGEDVNPLSIMITNAKLKNIDIQEAFNIIDNINSRAINIKEYAFPVWPSFYKYVPKNKFDFVKSYINSFYDTTIYDYVKMTIICNLDKIFDYKHDGNGIKYRQSKVEYSNLRDFLNNMIVLALKAKIDYQKSNPKKTYKIYNSSSTKYNNNIQDNDIDIIITSPPYCNMFDYFEVYKIELWTADIVKSYEDMRILKKSALRSNYNALINNDFIGSELLEYCLSNIQKNKCEQRKINMIKNYFFDMNLVMCNSYKYLKNNSYMFIVVGNSFYNAKPVITDEILCELAEKIGFQVNSILVARRLSTSSQQLKLIDDNDRKYLRESIIVLRKV